MRWGAILILLAGSFATCHAQGGLEALKAVLMPLRGQDIGYGEERGATAQLTVVKHQLRDWVEGRMTGLPRDTDFNELAVNLNRELQAAGFIPKDEASSLGTLGRIRFQEEGRFIILVTSVGIECGNDESAYLYANDSFTRRRIWQSEQLDYQKGHYKPQVFETIQIEPAEKLVFTLGKETWCSSGWHNAYYRVFRFGAELTLKPIVEGHDFAFVDGGLHGALQKDEVLIQYIVSAEGRPAVMRFKIEGNRARRIDPIALSPHDFAMEWQRIPWAEAVLRTDKTNPAKLRDWHESSGRVIEPEGGIGEAWHCKTPDLWQTVGELKKDPQSEERTPVYFLVRWTPPYRFQMVNVSDKPWPNCTERDLEAEKMGRTLFEGR